MSARDRTAANGDAIGTGAEVDAPPPEAWLDALARLYDLDLQEDPGDLDLYLALANRTGGPVLEFAIGSGRIAIPLAQAGHEVTGVDLDPGMLRRARRRAQAAGPEVAARIRLVEADVRDVRLPDPGTYRFAFIPFNSLLVFGDRRDQARAVASLAAHLAPDGLAVVDLWQPDADQLSRYDGRLGLEYVRRDPSSGRVVTKTASARHDASGRVELTTIYEESDQGGPVRRWVRQDRLRLVGPEELVAMAESAGLRVELLAGDYDLRGYEPGDERAILLASPGTSAIRAARRRARRAATPPTARAQGTSRSPETNRASPTSPAPGRPSPAGPVLD